MQSVNRIRLRTQSKIHVRLRYNVMYDVTLTSMVSVVGASRIQISALKQDILMDTLRRLPRSSQINTGIEP